MSISEKYIGYLDHFGETVTIRELWENPETAGLCGLRHDVDHDLELALEMAHLEYQKGFRSTYFILPETDYWLNDSKLIEKCLQLQDYGHEVGLHVNSLVEWVAGETDDIQRSLSIQLAKLRDGGIDVRGIAAHGDKRCYLENVSNYWCFEELRPKNPFVNEDGRTAEGPYEMDMTPRLRYPKSDRVLRHDGSIFKLWTIPLSSNNLDYHAWHVGTEAYFTDSGGRWQRSVDPLSILRTTDRWQVLMHPEHWRGSKRAMFFSSPNNDVVKSIKETLDACPVSLVEESVGDNEVANYSNLWSRLGALDGDSAVVCESPIITSQKQVSLFPNALHILILTKNEFLSLQNTKIRILKFFLSALGFEDKVNTLILNILVWKKKTLANYDVISLVNNCNLTDSQSIYDILKFLKIIVHQRLVVRNINQTSRASLLFVNVPSRFYRLRHSSTSVLYRLYLLLSLPLRKLINLNFYASELMLNKSQYKNNFRNTKNNNELRFNLKNIEYRNERSGLFFFRVDHVINSYFSLNGSRWHRTSSRSQNESSGYMIKSCQVLTVSIRYEFYGESGSIFVHYYDSSGDLIIADKINSLSNSANHLSVFLNPHPGACKFDVFFYFPKSGGSLEFRLVGWSVGCVDRRVARLEGDYCVQTH